MVREKGGAEMASWPRKLHSDLALIRPVWSHFTYITSLVIFVTFIILNSFSESNTAYIGERQHFDHYIWHFCGAYMLKCSHFNNSESLSGLEGSCQRLGNNEVNQWVWGWVCWWCLLHSKSLKEGHNDWVAGHGHPFIYVSHPGSEDELRVHSIWGVVTKS